MKKELINKKIEAFKEAFPDWKISKAGNYYAKLGKRERRVSHCYNNITKGTLYKLGTITKVPTYAAIAMLTKRGKVLHKSNGRFKPVKAATIEQYRNWGQVLLNSYYYKLVRIHYMGKKGAWLINYQSLYSMEQLAKSFSSLEEFKNYMGYGFMDTSEFIKAPLISSLIDLYNYNEVTKKIYVLEPLRRPNINAILSLQRQLGIFKEIPKSLKDQSILYNSLLNEELKRLDLGTLKLVEELIPF